MLELGRLRRIARGPRRVDDELVLHAGEQLRHNVAREECLCLAARPDARPGLEKTARRWIGRMPPASARLAVERHADFRADRWVEHSQLVLCKAQIKTKA